MNRQSKGLAVCGCQTHHRMAVGVDPRIKSSNLKRLRRIAGQVRGLERMVGEDRYCADILVQLASVQQALRGVGRLDGQSSPPLRIGRDSHGDAAPGGSHLRRIVGADLQVLALRSRARPDRCKEIQSAE